MKQIFLKLAASPAVRKALIALVLAVLAALGINLAGCGGSVKPSELPAYERCLNAAEAQAQAAVAERCGVGQPVSVCPAFDAIVEELERAQKECRP